VDHVSGIGCSEEDASGSDNATDKGSNCTSRTDRGDRHSEAGELSKLPPKLLTHDNDDGQRASASLGLLGQVCG
jgi:hypothetical protein